MTVNGPGEVCYSLRPFLEALQAMNQKVRVWVFIPPCQFASGWEKKIAQNLPLIERIVDSRSIFRFLFLERVTFPTSGLVLFMGGDLFYAYRLKRKSGYPLWAYGVPPRKVAKVDLFLVRFEKDFKNYPPDKRFLIGDLLQSLCLSPFERVQRFFGPGKPRFLFLPGSRTLLYPYILPFYSEVASLLRKQYYPESSFLLGFPEFVEPESLSPIITGNSSLFRSIWGHTSSLIEESDLVVMVPGSVNLEVAYRGKRGVVVLPLGEGVDKLPLQGFWGLLDVLPVWSKIVKPRFVERLNRQTKWVSLPNRVFDVEIFPECRGRITAREVAVKVREELEKGKVQKLPLIEKGSTWNAAELLAEKVCAFFKK